MVSNPAMSANACSSRQYLIFRLLAVLLLLHLDLSSSTTSVANEEQQNVEASLTQNSPKTRGDGGGPFVDADVAEEEQNMAGRRTRGYLRLAEGNLKRELDERPWNLTQKQEEEDKLQQSHRLLPGNEFSSENIAALSGVLFLILACLIFACCCPELFMCMCLYELFC